MSGTPIAIYNSIRPKPLTVASTHRQEEVMKTIMQKIEDMLVAITFAEAGELEEARRLAAIADLPDYAGEESDEETLEAA